jgi:hypothetical protein
MGYTHYWHRTKVEDQKKWDALVEFTRMAISVSAVEIHGSDGYGDPDLTKDLIRFNGKSPELYHETFLMSRNPRDDVPDFCKTNRKPYDVVVVAVLMEAERLGFLKMSSDGGEDDLVDGHNLRLSVLSAETKEKKG